MTEDLKETRNLIVQALAVVDQVEPKWHEHVDTMVTRAVGVVGENGEGVRSMRLALADILDNLARMTTSVASQDVEMQMLIWSGMSRAQRRVLEGMLQLVWMEEAQQETEDE